MNLHYRINLKPEAPAPPGVRNKKVVDTTVYRAIPESLPRSRPGIAKV